MHLSSREVHNEEELLSRIAKGEVASFRQLFTDMYPALYMTANRLLENEELAKDVVADMFLQVWETRATVTGIQDIKAYLYVATRNRVLRHLKKEKLAGQELTAFQQQHAGQISDNFLQAVYTAETIRTLHDAIQTLPPECKKVISLQLEGLGTNEIAQQLQLSPSAVSNQKARAIKLLREKLPFTTLLLLLAAV